MVSCFPGWTGVGFRIALVFLMFGVICEALSTKEAWPRKAKKDLRGHVFFR